MSLSYTTYLVGQLLGWLGAFLMVAHISLGLPIWLLGIGLILTVVWPSIRAIWSFYYYYFLHLGDD